MSFNFSEVEDQQFERVQDGTYEVTIAKFKGENNNGKKYISVHYVIRGDVEQPHKLSRVFGDIYPTQDGLPAWKIKPLAMAISNQLPRLRENFESLSDAIKYLLDNAKGKDLRIEVKNNESNGKTYTNVVGYEPSSLAVIEDPFASGSGIEITDDDLPF